MVDKTMAIIGSTVRRFRPTLLTCLFLPALYAAWFRVRENGAA